MGGRLCGYKVILQIFARIVMSFHASRTAGTTVVLIPDHGGAPRGRYRLGRFRRPAIHDAEGRDGGVLSRKVLYNGMQSAIQLGVLLAPPPS